MDRQKAFIFKEVWFTFQQYTFEEIDNVSCIIPKSNLINDDIKYYNIDDHKYTSFRTKYKEDLIENYPHTHLACLNIENNDEILHFVNTWGLLGLWATHKYSEATILPEKILYVGLRRDAYSSWYEHLPVHVGKLRWAEPLPVFKQAVIDYQNLISEINTIKTAKEESSSAMNTELKFGEMLSGLLVRPRWNDKTRNWNMDWKFNSLLEMIYLLTLLDLQSNSLIRCKREGCNSVFTCTNPTNEYCCDPCKNKHNVDQHRMREKVDEIRTHFPEVDEEWLINEIEALYNKGIRRRKQILKQIKIGISKSQ